MRESFQHVLQTIPFNLPYITAYSFLVSFIFFLRTTTSQARSPHCCELFRLRRVPVQPETDVFALGGVKREEIALKVSLNILSIYVYTQHTQLRTWKSLFAQFLYIDNIQIYHELAREPISC